MFCNLKEGSPSTQPFSPFPCRSRRDEHRSKSELNIQCCIISMMVLEYHLYFYMFALAHSASGVCNMLKHLGLCTLI